MQTPSESVKSHPTHKVGRELAGGLLTSDDFPHRFPFRLVTALDEKVEGFLVAHCGAMHLVVENRVDDGSLIEFKLMKP